MLTVLVLSPCWSEVVLVCMPRKVELPVWGVQLCFVIILLDLSLDIERPQGLYLHALN